MCGSEATTSEDAASYLPGCRESHDSYYWKPLPVTKPELVVFLKTPAALGFSALVVELGFSAEPERRTSRFPFNDGRATDTLPKPTLTGAGRCTRWKRLEEI